jgi:hypothetical protein
MNFDFADFSKGLSVFKSLFTFKHITVLVFVALALVLVCAPHRDNAEPFAQTCNDASCPFPRPKVITVTPIFITKISLENWQLDFPGEGWEYHEPSIPVIKLVRHNPSQECMVLLIKEPIDNMSFGQYVVESIRGFSEDGAQVTSLKQVDLNDNKFVLMESLLFGKDILMAWNGIKDGFGYSLSCFYKPDADAGNAQHDLCVEIAESLRIK